jgi:hypothetical protein
MDEDALEHALALGLRARGADVLTAREAKMINRPDDEQLEFATSLGRTLYSYNIPDYCRINLEWARSGRLHAGIIIGHQQRLPVGDEIRAILRVAHSYDSARIAGQVVFLGSTART